MSYIIDLIVLAIVAVTVLISAKRGFVRIFIETAGFLLACWVALSFNTPLANKTYDNMIEPAIVSSVAQATESTAELTTDSIWDELPDMLKTGISSFGITKQSLDETVSQNVGSSIESTVQSVSQELIKPSVTSLLEMVYAALLLAVLLLAVKLLARLVNRLFSIKLTRRLNQILGGIIGIPKGMVIAVLFCLLVSLVVSFHKGGVWIFTKESLQESWFFNHFNFTIKNFFNP